MEELKISLVQTHLEWENREANLEHFENKLIEIEETDLILLPEMFSTGFSMSPDENYETVNGTSVNWMKKIAAKMNTAICGSLIIKEEGNYFNRLFFITAEGETYQYDKKHLFTLAGEQNHYKAGDSRLLIDYKGWKILPFVCYDLRFPVWCRNMEEAELMLFVANWPERRSEPWKALLKARAIENMCYVAAVNRIGEDGNGVMHSGDSRIYDEMGNQITNITPHQSMVSTVTLSRSKVYKSRERFSFLADRDKFELT